MGIKKAKVKELELQWIRNVILVNFSDYKVVDMKLLINSDNTNNKWVTTLVDINKDTGVNVCLQFEAPNMYITINPMANRTRLYTEFVG